MQSTDAHHLESVRTRVRRRERAQVHAAMHDAYFVRVRRVDAFDDEGAVIRGDRNDELRAGDFLGEHRLCPVQVRSMRREAPRKLRQPADDPCSGARYLLGALAVFPKACAMARRMRAVAPAAALNLIVVQSFGILFLPSAARLFARNDLVALNQHHWESVGWVAVLSFPIFAATFCVAPQLVVLLFGHPYAESAVVLAILSIGSFAGVVTAFTNESLQILNRTRALLGSNIAIMVVSVVLAVLLCPTYGALGAAVAVTAARVLGVVIRQAALLRSREMQTAPHTIRDLWRKLAAATTVVSVVGWVWQPALIIQGVLLVIVCLWLLRACARAIDIGRTFPELLRIPGIGRWMTA
jgi:hypothetical protein